MPITDTQRRVLAQMSIPRNVEDLVAVVRPFILTNPDQMDTLLRDDLAKQGWIKKLGRHDDSGKLAAAVQADKGTMELPDEKAEIYARRMQRPDLAWRMQGDLWMLTDAGLAELHTPAIEGPPMTPTQVQDTVNAEWDRTKKDSEFKRDENDALVDNISHLLLLSEFETWFRAVADDTEARWNVRPVHPGGAQGGASGYSDAYEISLLDAENQKTALGAVVDPWFMALSILAFTDADTGTTADNGSHIPTYTGYARKSVAGTDMAAGSGSAGSVSNVNAIIFAACTAGSSTILACGNCSTVTVGVLRKWGDVGSTSISTTQTPAQFAVGAYTTTTT